MQWHFRLRFSTHSCLGVEVVAKPPNWVWGAACNVTDKSPIKPGARRVARRCYKRAEVSWVWPVLAILVKFSERSLSASASSLGLCA